MRTLVFVVTTLLLGLPAVGQGITRSQPSPETVSDVGQFYPWLMQRPQGDEEPLPLSFLNSKFKSLDRWKRDGRRKMAELLRAEEIKVPLDVRELEVVQKLGYRRIKVRYRVTHTLASEAFLLVPGGISKPSPAVLALHDHGGFYFFGKEKITEIENPPEILRKFIHDYYGGRTYADELARRGFVVLVPDAFYFGSQRLDISKVSDFFLKELRNLKEGSDEYIRAFNRFSSGHETLLAKTLFTAGKTWPGILFHGDRVALDYLQTRPEVDMNRVGCMGLSIGGFRAAHLAGLDSRIRAGVVVGWMTTYDSLLQQHLRNHTWMIYVPGQTQFMDLTDVAGLHAPGGLMVLNCAQDQLFPRSGMDLAVKRIEAIYAKAGVENKFVARMYDEPHRFTIAMQEDAFQWLDKQLKVSTEP